MMTPDERSAVTEILFAVRSIASTMARECRSGLVDDMRDGVLHRLLAAERMLKGFGGGGGGEVRCNSPRR